jgi:hypothetical protein
MFSSTSLLLFISLLLASGVTLAMVPTTPPTCSLAAIAGKWAWMMDANRMSPPSKKGKKQPPKRFQGVGYTTITGGKWTSSGFIRLDFTPVAAGEDGGNVTVVKNNNGCEITLTSSVYPGGLWIGNLIDSTPKRVEFQSFGPGVIGTIKTTKAPAGKCTLASISGDKTYGGIMYSKTTGMIGYEGVDTFDGKGGIKYDMMVAGKPNKELVGSATYTVQDDCDVEYNVEGKLAYNGVLTASGDAYFLGVSATTTDLCPEYDAVSNVVV